MSAKRLRVVLLVFPAASSRRISTSLAPGEGSCKLPLNWLPVTVACCKRVLVVLS